MMGTLTHAAAADSIQSTKTGGMFYMLPYLHSHLEIIDAREPVLVLMSATDVDKIEMAWSEGSDGQTALSRVVYEVHLSETENFTPSEATLRKTVKGDKQTEVDGLDLDKVYYGKVIARYSRTGTVSKATNEMHTKTLASLKMLPDATPVLASELGLGAHDVGEDGTTYTFNGGTPPEPGNVLFSEDAAHGMTLRTVDEAHANSDGTVTVKTSDAALSDIIEEGEINSSFQMIDVTETAVLSNSTAQSSVKYSAFKDGSRTATMKWKNRLLTIEQTDFAYQEKDYSFTPMGDQRFLMKMSADNSVTQSFTTELKAGFEPNLNTNMRIGWNWLPPYPKLKSAEFSATGKLSMEARATYNFDAAGNVEKEVKIFEKTYTSVFSVGVVPVYQEVILSLTGTFEAKAEAAIKAEAWGKLEQEIGVGIKFDGSSWKPFVKNDTNTDSSLTLNIAGKASAEIRLIPKVEVKYYKVVGGYLTAEPFLQSNFATETVTDNPFIQAELLSQGVSPFNLSELNAFIGMECNIGLTLPSIIEKIGGDAFGPKCVLGTEDCLVNFGRLYLFDVPVLSLGRTSAGNVVQLTAADGKLTPVTPNLFDPNSVHWYVVPDSSSVAAATITPNGCTKSGSTTTCKATFMPASGASAEEYTIFASGHGALGEIARQYKEIKLSPPSPAEVIKVDNGGKWGVWGDPYMCPEFTYVVGFTLRTEESQGGGDDTALNNLELICSDGTRVREKESSEGGPAHEWGEWRHPDAACPAGRYMTGYKLKVEGRQEDGDDTAANSMLGICSDDSKIICSDSEDWGWGTWGSTASCPSGKRVCGAALKIEPYQADGGDDTAVNDVALYCCSP
jgi:hypothetical protein